MLVVPGEAITLHTRENLYECTGKRLYEWLMCTGCDCDRMRR